MDWTKKSISVIKKLQLTNGGFLATPKSDGYPYIYPRDSVIMTKALNVTGNYKDSEKFYYFMKKHARIDYFKEVFHRYNMKGIPAVTRKHEHDNNGLIINGIYDTYLHNKNKKFLIDMWPIVLILVKSILKWKKPNGLISTERSIHEFYRLENGYEIWCNSVSCRALFDASEIASVLERKESKLWKSEAEKLKKNILKKMFNKKKGVFVKNLKHKEIVDSTQLSPFYFSLTADKKILKKTLKILKKEIWISDIGGFRRFKKFGVVKDWHWYTGGSGAWIVITCIVARFYSRLGNKKMFKSCMSFVEEIASRTNGLLPEHVASKVEYDCWKKNEMEYNDRIINAMKSTENLYETHKKKYKNAYIYWALPLGWSHAEYILTKSQENGED